MTTRHLGSAVGSGSSKQSIGRPIPTTKDNPLDTQNFTSYCFPKWTLNLLLPGIYPWISSPTFQISVFPGTNWSLAFLFFPFKQSSIIKAKDKSGFSAEQRMLTFFRNISNQDDSFVQKMIQMMIFLPTKNVPRRLEMLEKKRALKFFLWNSSGKIFGRNLDEKGFSSHHQKVLDMLASRWG